MGLAWLFLSFQGRIGRAVWWLVIAGTLCLDRALYYMTRGSDDFTLYAVGGVAVSAMQIAPTVKRLHDVGRSGWWYFPYFVLPAVLYLLAVESVDPEASIVFILMTFAGLMIILWAIFEMGFVRGPRGPNRYGDDPLD